MRNLKKLLVLASLVGAASLTACSSSGTKHDGGGGDLASGDGGPTTGDGSTDGMTGDLPGSLEFEAFVVGLIKNDTTSSALPTTLNDKTFTDSMDPATFAPLFQ